jgi:REP element-mobilizing transposase RayT
MSWVRVYIHYVFSTKKKIPFLSSQEIRSKVHEHITLNAKEKNIWLDCVNGYHDHLHCLVSLGRTQTISDVAKLIKGESSFWMNKNELVKGRFSWQDDFWAVGVSESHVNGVRRYIQGQEEKHRKVSFTEEVNDFMEKYGWEIIKD